MNGPFPRCAEALIVIFANAVARCGIYTALLELDRPCNASSDEQWRAFTQRADSVALITWCADKMALWATPEFMKLQLQAPLCADMPLMSFKIMSTDGLTDWTLAAWHIHRDTTSSLLFSKDVLHALEEELAHPREARD